MTKPNEQSKKPAEEKPKTNPAEELKVEELEERVAPMKVH
jgi:hypothetical protein